MTNPLFQSGQPFAEAVAPAISTLGRHASRRLHAEKRDVVFSHGHAARLRVAARGFCRRIRSNRESAPRGRRKNPRRRCLFQDFWIRSRGCFEREPQQSTPTSPGHQGRHDDLETFVQFAAPPAPRKRRLEKSQTVSWREGSVRRQGRVGLAPMRPVGCCRPAIIQEAHDGLLRESVSRHERLSAFRVSRQPFRRAKQTQGIICGGHGLLQHHIRGFPFVFHSHRSQPVFRMPAAMALIEREITRRKRSSWPGSRACFSRPTWITLSGSR